MACALCVSNAPRLVAFPLRLIGFCRLNQTLSVKEIFFFATTVSEGADPTRNKIIRGVAGDNLLQKLSTAICEAKQAAVREC
jgi:hypothetical protein